MTEKGFKEYRFPEIVWSHSDNAIGRKVAHAESKITIESTIKNGIDNTEKRPISLRSERAEILKQIKKTDNIEEKTILIEQAHDLDEIFSEFLGNRKQIEVELEGLGTQSSEYTEIKYNKTDLNKAPIIIIPGISNDLDGIGEFPIKLAMQSKRRIIMFTHPESWHGKVTEEFAEAIDNSDNFKPHTDFFRKAINKTIGDDQEIDIIGVSAGSIIITELMKDKKFKKRVNKASLIVPSGIVNMSPKNIIRGAGKELKSLLFFESNPLKISVLHPEKIKKTADDHENTQTAAKNIRNKLSKKYNWWKNNLESGRGEKTTVVICDADGVTNGKDGLEKISQNESLDVHLVEKSSHGTLASIPEKILKELNY